MNLKIWFSDKLTGKISRTRMDAFLRLHATESNKILDLGSKGRPYKKYFPNAFSLDIRSEPGLSVVGDANYLPFKDGSFETIVCTEVLEHLDKPWIAIAEMKRVLKQKGTLILTTRFIFPIHGSPHDYYRYTKYGLKSLFSEWGPMQITEESVGLETIGVLFQRLGFQSITRPSFLRFFFFVLGIIFFRLNFIMAGGYGEINRTTSDNSILCSGYYLVVKKG